jgi:acyl-CoA synthetase (AMP-forming)/AMP-acid ligase II
VIVGAERIRSGTLQRFTDAFAPSGFSPETFVPAYGLAEATLLVTAGPLGRSPVLRHFDVGPSAVSRPAISRQPRNDIPLVDCGEVRPGMSVVIAEPDTLQALPAGRIGEICIAGDSVGRGYWSDPAQTAAAFGTSVQGAAGQYLRTGDLGALIDGQLFVSGRRKDLIIIDGVNHYPTDLEATAEAAHPAVRSGCCAVVAIDEGDAERVVVLAEVSFAGLRLSTEQSTDHPAEQVTDHSAKAGSPAPMFGGSPAPVVTGPPAPVLAGQAADRPAGVDDVARHIRRALSSAHAVAVGDVALLRPGTLSFTSSGKLQRFACREAYRSGQLDSRRINLPAAPAVSRTDEVAV